MSLTLFFSLVLHVCCSVGSCRSSASLLAWSTLPPCRLRIPLRCSHSVPDLFPHSTIPELDLEVCQHSCHPLRCLQLCSLQRSFPSSSSTLESITDLKCSQSVGVHDSFPVLGSLLPRLHSTSRARVVGQIHLHPVDRPHRWNLHFRCHLVLCDPLQTDRFHRQLGR